MTGDALTIARDAFASADDIRAATGLLGLVLTILFAGSFTTALQRVYLRAWRRPPRSGVAESWRGPACLLAALVCIAALGALRGVLDSGVGTVVFGLVAFAATTGLWWFNSWLLLRGEVRARVLLPSGALTSVALTGYAVSSTIWMSATVTDNESQFGSFGVALALVTWFSGAAICVLVGACAGPVFAEDTGRVGSLIRAGDPHTLTPGAEPPLPPPARGLTLRDAFRNTDEP
jgi:membrane protein